MAAMSKRGCALCSSATRSAGLSERTENRITVFDECSDVYRDEDLNRFADFSDVVALSDRQTMIDLLAA